jgi:uncharacterized SAM-binding protein YcdF (DUF218 family)
VIVVLAGWLQPPDDFRPQAELGEDTLRRCFHAVQLYRRTGPCSIVVSGGKVDTSEPGPTLAEAMHEFLVGQGVPDEAIVQEDQSRNTYENAALTARLLHNQGITDVMLVTDAIHLPRAVRCFEAQGVSVTPSGVAYRATRFEGALGDFLPSPTAAANNQKVLHEWLGMAWYWMNGRFQAKSSGA